MQENLKSQFLLVKSEKTDKQSIMTCKLFVTKIKLSFLLYRNILELHVSYNTQFASVVHVQGHVWPEL